MARLIAVLMNTSDGLLARTGLPTNSMVVVRGANLVSSGVNLVYFRDGASDGLIRCMIQTTGAGSAFVQFAEGIDFPRGCYIDVSGAGTIDAASTVLLEA